MLKTNLSEELLSHRRHLLYLLLIHSALELAKIHINRVVRLKQVKLMQLLLGSPGSLQDAHKIELRLSLG